MKHMDAPEVRADRETVMGVAGLVRDLLQPRQAMAMREILEHAQAPETIIRLALGLLMEQGDVERLRPVFYDRDDCDYYRLLRESDGRYLFGPQLRHTLWMGRFEAAQVA